MCLRSCGGLALSGARCPAQLLSARPPQQGRAQELWPKAPGQGMSALGKTMAGPPWGQLAPALLEGVTSSTSHRSQPCNPWLSKPCPTNHWGCAVDEMQLAHAWSLGTTDTILAGTARILPASPGPLCCLLSTALSYLHCWDEYEDSYWTATMKIRFCPVVLSFVPQSCSGGFLFCLSIQNTLAWGFQNS